MEDGFEVVNLSGVIPTPNIRTNGNWFVGNKDTGVAAKGETGEQGIQGLKGDQGIQGDKGDQGEKGIDADPTELKRLSDEIDAVNQSLKDATTIINTEHIVGVWGDATLYSIHKVFTYTGSGWITNQQILSTSPTNTYIDMQNSYFSNGTYTYPINYAESTYEIFARVRPDMKSLDFYLGTGHASGGTFAITIRYWK